MLNVKSRTIIFCENGTEHIRNLTVKNIVVISMIALLTGCSTIDVAEQKSLKIKKSKSEVDGKNTFVEIASLPAQLRNAYIWTDATGKRVICPEPFPDVAASSSLNATANAVNNLSSAINNSIDLERQKSLAAASNQVVGGADGNSSGTNSDSDFVNNFSRTYGSNNSLDQSINLGLETTSTMVNLGGRTDIVLLAREMMFANCMASANQQIGTESTPVQVNLTKIFDVLNDMVKADRAKADAKKAQAEANQAQAETNKINAVIKAVDKLDPKVLAGLQTGITEQYMKSYLTVRDTCISNAAGDTKKIKNCDDEFRRAVTALMKI